MHEISTDLKIPIPAIQLIIITGFLGAGKTSFLAKLLSLDEMSNTAVIINEFGEIGLDHLLIDYVHDQISQLPNGCLCCSARGELIEKLLDLADGKLNGLRDFDRIIIETTGVADTANLVENLWKNSQLIQKFQLARIITIVSALEWQNPNAGEFGNQLAICDTVIISKADLLDRHSRDEDLAHLVAEIELINPSADHYLAPLSPTKLKEFINPASQIPFQSQTPDDRFHNTNFYKTCTLQHNSPIKLGTIEIFMNLLLTRHGDTLLRSKGLVFTAQRPATPLVFQTVKSTPSPFTWLKQWEGEPQTQITLIHTSRSNRIFLELFSSILDIPTLDQPDKAALEDNPLSITGIGRFRPEK